MIRTMYIIQFTSYSEHYNMHHLGCLFIHMLFIESVSIDSLINTERMI